MPRIAVRCSTIASSSMRRSAASDGTSPSRAFSARSLTAAVFRAREPGAAELLVRRREHRFGRRKRVRAEGRLHPSEDRRRGLARELLVDDRFEERLVRTLKARGLQHARADGVDDGRELRIGRRQRCARGFVTLHFTLTVNIFTVFPLIMIEIFFPDSGLVSTRSNSVDATPGPRVAPGIVKS